MAKKLSVRKQMDPAVSVRDGLPAFARIPWLMVDIMIFQSILCLLFNPGDAETGGSSEKSTDQTWAPKKSKG